MHGFILWLLPSLADVSCVSLFRPEITAEKTMQRKLSDDFALPWNAPIARFCKVLQNRSIDEKPKKADCDQNFSARRLFINFDEPDYLFISKNQGKKEPEMR